MRVHPPYALKTPCTSCPFRSDIRPFIRPERVDEIEQGLVRGEFPCHKTVNYDSAPERDDGLLELELRDSTGEVHCAGALILLEKLGQPSQMMRISERIGVYDARQLDMNAPVYDSFEEMREAHEREFDKRHAKRRTRR